MHIQPQQGHRKRLSFDLSVLLQVPLIIKEFWKILQIIKSSITKNSLIFQGQRNNAHVEQQS
ncbi:hypothetical protein SERLADRAFT_391535 [Serpula lacrymans var. lacrymans S7.9]|uniref:Uncharacterized protein n=1 Tax=Serpula lacrymans var. lacrymans (strain S7.9) TaxID=578457 RepID=F8P0B9_SERL9|nr:uncharacterized protein SERLADRAFT_391535 [Serpula lacrymans var. lacrymans S7.9]EGO23492.1 hypothetical protein SERLADRAFT_391535 [Serpula lacrymans var. lacrymans S7.9]